MFSCHCEQNVFCHGLSNIFIQALQRKTIGNVTCIVKNNFSRSLTSSYVAEDKLLLQKMLSKKKQCLFCKLPLLQILQYLSSGGKGAVVGTGVCYISNSYVPQCACPLSMQDIKCVAFYVNDVFAMPLSKQSTTQEVSLLQRLFNNNYI